MENFRFYTFVIIIYLSSIGQISKTENNENDEDSNITCYRFIGCFPQTAPWVSLLRPLPKPWSPEKIDVRLYSLNTYNRGLRNTITPYTKSGTIRVQNFLNGNLHTVVIIHGFYSSVKSPWMQKIANAYLNRIYANVFLVDWQNGANHANYLQVAANTRVVAAIISRFLKLLIKSGRLYPGRLHLIGHSLGAHICGYIGKSINGIQRITALDPAQICFEAVSPKVRLFHEDAKFIDVLHTNSMPAIPLFGLGFMTPIGDVDFYVNGGMHQPNCMKISANTSEIQTALDVAKLPVKVLGGVISCSHSMSIDYFIEAIRNITCTFWGYKTGIVESVLTTATLGQAEGIFQNTSERCTLETCSPMGLDTFSYPARGAFLLTTTLSAPYCSADKETAENMRQELYNYYYLNSTTSG